MISWLAYIAFFFLAVRIGIAMINVLGKNRLSPALNKNNDIVSVLIPARNEAHNVGELIRGLQRLNHESLEIIIYDDASEDQTAEVIMQLASLDNRIQLIKGTSLPDGWLGKNHACHLLAQHAKGAFLLFLDADVRVKPELICDLLASMKEEDLELLSLFPEQKMESLGEKMIVPIMNLILLSFLPLQLSKRSKNSSFAAANGQCMMFRASTYHTHKFHSLVRMEPVEDIRIMIRMKQMQLATRVLLSGGQINCRMYSGYRESLNGFARSFHQFFGNRDGLMLAYGFWTTLAPVFTMLAFGKIGLLAYVLGVMLLQLLVSWISRQPMLLSLLLIPAKHIAMLHIIAYSLMKRKSHSLRWKGRLVPS